MRMRAGLALLIPLCLFSQAKPQPDDPGKQFGVMYPEPWPEGQESVAAKSLPFDPRVPKYNLREEPFHGGPSEKDHLNARRVFALILPPRQQLSFSLESEEQAITMRVHVPEIGVAEAWQQTLRKVNTLSAADRRRSVSIANTTPTAQVVYLILYGHHGYSYKLSKQLQTL